MAEMDLPNGQISFVSEIPREMQRWVEILPLVTVSYYFSILASLLPELYCVIDVIFQTNNAQLLM